MDRKALKFTVWLVFHNGGWFMEEPNKYNRAVILSILLLVIGEALFYIGVNFTLPDSTARYAYVASGILTVPLSLFWAVFAFINAKTKNTKRLSLIAMALSGTILLIGLLKII